MITNYLSRENTDCLKGICAIMVVICHVCAKTGVGASFGLGPIYSAFGYWAVSGFMFISGYGLMCSLRNGCIGGYGYLNSFLKKRIFPIYLLIVLLIFFYLGLNLLLSIESPNLESFFLSFLFGSTIIPFGWYLQSIVVIYLLFYISALMSTKHNNVNYETPLFFLMALTSAAYVGLCVWLGIGNTWYETILSFLAGMIVCVYKQNVDLLLGSVTKSIWVLFVITFLFAVSFVLGCGGYLPIPLAIIVKMISSPLFVLCWLPLMRFFSLANPVTLFLSKYYLEIYIIQGMVYLLLRNRHWSLDSSLIYFVVAISLVCFFAWLIKPLTSSFMNWAKNL